MFRPMPIEPIPLKRPVSSAPPLPEATGTCDRPMSWVRCSQMRLLARYPPHTDSPRTTMAAGAGHHPAMRGGPLRPPSCECRIRSHRVDLLGPTRMDYHWQAREGVGFDAQHFSIDGDRQQASCPAGKAGIDRALRDRRRESPRPNGVYLILGSMTRSILQYT
jgi:hypothetical protein